MGKSSSGKDTIFQEMCKMFPKVKTITLYTTRPIREKEIDGKEYFFVKEETFMCLEDKGKIIEEREYNTMHGIWRYFTVDDGQIELAANNYFAIGTLESYAKVRQYFGDKQVIPIYIEVEAGERLSRALERERRQEEPKYTELCRRFLADEQDFSEENLEKESIKYRFENLDIQDCIQEIGIYIQEHI